MKNQNLASNARRSIREHCSYITHCRGVAILNCPGDEARLAKFPGGETFDNFRTVGLNMNAYFEKSIVIIHTLCILETAIRFVCLFVCFILFCFLCKFVIKTLLTHVILVCLIACICFIKSYQTLFQYHTSKQTCINKNMILRACSKSKKRPEAIMPIT